MMSATTGPHADVVLTGVEKGAVDDAVADAVKKAAIAATDFSWLSHGDTVVIKPVVNSGNPYPTTTSPVGIKAMAELLKEKGAGRVIVTDTASVTYVWLTGKGVIRGSTRKLMQKCGVAQAAEEGGAELYFPEEHGRDAFYEEVPEVSTHWKSPVTMPALLKQADHVVLMPRCSRHMMAGSTLGLKAAVGWWRPETRIKLHCDMAFYQEKIAEANTAPTLLEKQRLTLTVADKVLATFGPDWGHVHRPDTGLVIASESMVAHDMVSLAWLLMARKATPKSKKRWAFRDPHNSLIRVNALARRIASMFGKDGDEVDGKRRAVTDIKSVRDCPVLGRAFQVFSGAPRVRLERPDASVPDAVVKNLDEHVMLAL
jgi:uncharacterized protein (DUF362 family)